MLGSPELLFRLFGYSGLVVVAALELSAGVQPGGVALLAAAVAWPPAWVALVSRHPTLASGQLLAGRLAHAAECAAVVALAIFSQLAWWLPVAVSLLCLTGVTALAGFRLLGPCSAAIGGVLVLASPVVTAVDRVSLAGGALVGGFLLALAWLSFLRVRALAVTGRRASEETARLRERTARLERYVPEALPALIAPAPDDLQSPREQFATVAFIDVVGFVELVAARPVTEIAEVLNDFMGVVAALTRRRGGVVGKFLGDGVLVYFAQAPGADARLRWQGAVGCARLCLDLRPAITELLRCWQQRGLTLEMDIRVGVASGYCAIGDWGGDGRLDYTPIGMPVNLASRLQALSAPGGVTVTQATAALLREQADLGAALVPLGSISVKGAGDVVVHGFTPSAKVPSAQHRQETGRDRKGPLAAGAVVREADNKQNGRQPPTRDED